MRAARCPRILPPVLLLLLTLAGRPAAAEPSSRFVEVPGGRLWVEVSGEGPPLVLLHDGLVWSATWDEQVLFFSRFYTVVRYDRRGYGRSDPAQAPYSDVDDLHAVVQALKLGPAVLAGCSSGGGLAVDYALAHPEQVTALVLVGAVVSGMPYSAHFNQRSAENYRPLIYRDDLAGTIAACANDRYLIDPANTRARERVRELLTRSPGSLLATYQGSRPPERPAAGRLAEVRVPTLIVVGASDIPDVHAHAGALEAGIVGSRRQLIAGAGHLVHLEQPATFNREVLTFLQPARAAALYLAELASPLFAAEGRRLLAQVPVPPSFDIQEAGTERRGEIRVVDLTYASPKGGRVPAYLVLPAAPGRHPAALFLHPGQGDRSTFLDEAVDLAGRGAGRGAGQGVVSLLISAPDKRPEYPRQKPFEAAASQGEWLQILTDLHRGLDLLAARPEVDPDRLVYVGHSLGATVGGMLLGTEPRLRAAVLMAGLPAYSRAGEGRYGGFFRGLLTPAEQAAYEAALAPLDAVHYLRTRPPVPLLLQFAKRDEFISPWDAEVYLQAAGPPQEVKWYDTDHSFNEQARRDRDEWLLRVVGGL